MDAEPYRHRGSTVSAILQRTLALIADNANRGMAALIVLAGLGIMVDSGFGGSGLEFVLTVLTLAMQYWVSVSLLERLGLRFATRPRFPAFFLLGILTSLGIMAGLILLVVPGIILLVRWSISVPAVVAEDSGVIEAIGYSWRKTSARFWPILAAFLIVFSPALLGLGGTFLVEAGFEMGMATTIAFEVLLNASLIAGWHMAVAIYAITMDNAQVSKVFA